jgi:hypothetical protein
VCSAATEAFRSRPGDPVHTGYGLHTGYGPLGPSRCRFISRYRTRTSDDLATRLAYGAAIEPIGFAMDRRMLLGVKERVERAR